MEDGNQAVGNWLAAQALGDKPRLLEQLQVDDGWQLAVETVLAITCRRFASMILAAGAHPGPVEHGRWRCWPVAPQRRGPNSWPPAFVLAWRADALLAGCAWHRPGRRAGAAAGAGDARIGDHTGRYLAGTELVACHPPGR